MYSMLTHFPFLGTIIYVDPMIGFIHFLGSIIYVDPMSEFIQFYQIIMIYIVITMRISFNISSRTLQLTYSNIKYILIHKTIVNTILCRHVLVLINILLLCIGTVHPNPGWVPPETYEQNTLSVCHWNINGLLANNVVKIPLPEAFLETYKYDVVILSDTFITCKIKTDEYGVKINGCTMKRCDHPSDHHRGGVCVYHKASLPLQLMPGMTTPTDTLVMGALYRSPYTMENSDKQNPYVSIIIVGFNAKNTR